MLAKGPCVLATSDMHMLGRLRFSIAYSRRPSREITSSLFGVGQVQKRYENILVHENETTM